MFDNKVILVTGGTGSFGKTFIKKVLNEYNPKKLIIFSRDEFKQFEMQQEKEFQHPNLRFFLGDIRDYQRLKYAFSEVNIVVHAAALKQVVAAEYNPFETIKTNILGAENIINAAIDNNVEKVISLSTDKAVNPVNLYGATKLCSDKLFIAGNRLVGQYKDTKFSVVRYGNVIGSRGSVIPLFKKQKKEGLLTITDERMTRFWITLEDAVDFVIQSFKTMNGGEIFVPKLPSMNIIDLASAIAPECEKKIIGIRPGEKIHEVLITEDEARTTVEDDHRYIILGNFAIPDDYSQLKKVPEFFMYESSQTEKILSVSELQSLIDVKDKILTN